MGRIPISLKFPISYERAAPDDSRRYGIPTVTEPGTRKVKINVLTITIAQAFSVAGRGRPTRSK